LECAGAVVTDVEGRSVLFFTKHCCVFVT